MITVRWECEHGHTTAHWVQIEASRASICAPFNVELEPVEWCDGDNAPARFCNHEGNTTTVFRRVRRIPQMTTRAGR